MNKNNNSNKNEDVINLYENEIKQLMEKNNKLLKKNEKYKANINLFLQENKEANKHIQKITQEINDIKNKNSKILMRVYLKIFMMILMRSINWERKKQKKSSK